MFGSKYVPCSAIRSSSGCPISTPCSMELQPASTARRTLSAANNAVDSGDSLRSVSSSCDRPSASKCQPMCTCVSTPPGISVRSPRSTSTYFGCWSMPTILPPSTMTAAFGKTCPRPSMTRSARMVSVEARSSALNMRAMLLRQQNQQQRHRAGQGLDDEDGPLRREPADDARTHDAAQEEDLDAQRTFMRDQTPDQSSREEAVVEPLIECERGGAFRQLRRTPEDAP